MLSSLSSRVRGDRTRGPASLRRGLARVSVAVVASVGWLGAPHAARATPSRTVSGTVTLGSDQCASNGDCMSQSCTNNVCDEVYDTLTVSPGGIVNVVAFAAGMPMATGWLSVKANTIRVAQGGAIVADGDGYVGVDGMAGGCSSKSTMCAQAGTVMGYPGGGGGFFGSGANGASEVTKNTCVDLGAMAQGGAAFFSMTSMMLDLGSAGGASDLSGPATAGYTGGGGIRLAAAVIVIDGTVTANGAGSDGTAHFGGVGPGGGSGGAIEITAASLTGMGMISVKGGAGAPGVGLMPGQAGNVPNNGGGGSGGVVLLHLPPPGTSSPVTVVATGGKTGDCGTLAGAAGGMVPAPLSSACVDVDGDGDFSSQCGGNDCDDSDPTVHPGAEEICNGKDDNCDGKIDEAPNNCTKIGEVCGVIAGMPGCVPAANDGGLDGGDLPESIAYGGGCEIPAPVAGARGVPLALGLAVAALAARRRRRTG